MTKYIKEQIDSSSLIKAVFYEPSTKILLITFTNGQEYSYYKVNEDVVSSLLSAESVGGYFIKNIKGNYKFTKLEK